MAIINGLDTNDQSARADLRKQGYFIDNSGVYAPGAGQRQGDTWSGGNASRNTLDDGHRLPVSAAGTPISPSNGFTGPNTGAVMYRGDPKYQSLFGLGTPGFSSAPTPWAPGGGWNGRDPMNYLGGNPNSVGAAPGQQTYAQGMVSAAAQTPFADWLTQYMKSQQPSNNVDAAQMAASAFGQGGNPYSGYGTPAGYQGAPQTTDPYNPRWGGR